MSVLKIKDKTTGKWVNLPAIKGDEGKSAYEQAVEGGYEGTEEEFCEMVAGFPTEKHTQRKDNPHGVTAEQVEAVPITGGIVQGNLAINKSGAPGLEFYTGQGFAILIKNAKNDVVNPENNYDYGVLISDYAEETPGAGSLNLMLSYSAVEQNQFSMKSGLRLASIINGEAKYYNIYGEHNKPTASDVGALPATGGTVSGNIDLLTAFMPCITLRTNKAYTQIIRNASDAVEDGLIIRDVSDMTDNNSHLSLKLRHVYAKTRPDKALVLSVCENGTVTEYVVFSEHIKKTGTYNGSGQTATETVNVGGVGNALLITNDGGSVAMVTSAGGWWKNTNSANINGFLANECNFTNGVLTLNTTAVALNMSGITYTYQVL